LLELLPERARALAIGVLCCVSLPFVACSTVDVSVGWDPRARFDQLRTWAWAPTKAAESAPRARPTNDQVARRIERSVERMLGARGFREVSPSEKPDIYVAYHVALDDELDTGTMYRNFQVGPYFGRWDRPEDYIEQYERGTVLLDVIDTSEDELIWRGRAQAHLQDVKDPVEREARTEEAVRQMLERLPKL
jgi:hypothetical protein